MPPPRKKSRSSVNDDSEDKHARLARELSYMELQRRFGKVKIHVDVESGVPKHVWYQFAREKGLSEHCKYAVLGKFYKVGGPSLNEWLKPACGIRSAHLKFAEIHIDYLAQFLMMEERRTSRCWTLSEGSMDLPALEIKDHLEILGLTEDVASPAEFVTCIRMAFLHDMHNSVARDGLRCILEFAGKISFGPGFPRHSATKILTLGSSSYKVEGFPINVTTEAPHMKCDLVNSKSFGSDTDTHSEEDVSKSSDSGSYPRAFPRAIAPKQSHVFSDMIVTSVDDSGWMKILMVCEVKSGYAEFHTMDNVKLVRQMIGACMHQTEVFGLLVNAEKAKLVKLVHYPNQKQLIFFDQIDQYYFSLDADDCNNTNTSFRADELKRLFHDLVKVLSYAKEEILKVDPLPDEPDSYM